ncbi:hypothetical protein IPN41_00765 [Candidatus Falkowbacteria bacterium]|nr:MAG: hypothetical protein IPN41_00765 [Candidatus Falkowbacteria bacterium]
MSDTKSFFVLTLSLAIEAFDIPSHQAIKVAKKIGVGSLNRASKIFNLLTPEIVSMINRSRRPADQVKLLISSKVIEANGGVKKIIEAVFDCSVILSEINNQKVAKKAA